MSNKSKRDDELQRWMDEADRENRNCNRLEVELGDLLAENAALRAENAELRFKIADLERDLNELLGA